MNRPPEEYLIVEEERLLAFVTRCFERAGTSPGHAACISRLLVNSDLRGVRSHGTRQVNHYCRFFETGELNPDPDIAVLQESPTQAALDGDGSLGYLPMVKASEMAVDKAREFGLGIATVRHIGHYGSAGHYARICMEAGMIGFSVQGTRDHGNRRGNRERPKLAYYGNPPICFALPSGEGDPIVLDAATCIMADYQRGPEFDALHEKIPAAFFKSMGYTAVATMLGGGLAGVGLPRAGEVKETWPAAGSGGMVLAIRIDGLLSEADFRAEVDRLVADVRTSYEPMPGMEEALLPGAIEERRMQLHRREGIRYGELEEEQLREVGARLGVPLPWDE